MKLPMTRFPFRKPKARNLEARELHTTRYSIKVIPSKVMSIFRKRKHKGIADEKD